MKRGGRFVLEAFGLGADTVAQVLEPALSEGTLDIRAGGEGELRIARPDATGQRRQVGKAASISAMRIRVCWRIRSASDWT
ncbi:hypothetical protein GCM10017621_08450 [Maricaulis virginensis]|uniref:Uncharacterized protein n=1 Tax=Maricaulis virginensis TaxID=144022 RepID=A0A9W6IKN0_9PROT|nr:hypothetical protein GCM10017621_08450 [Maricaulis virginensis]